MELDYSKPQTPNSYKCDECKRTGIKLWRECGRFEPRVLCCQCAAWDQDKNISDIDANGLRLSSEFPHRRTDAIGVYIPAIPDPEGVGYWGYTSTPQAGIDWWRSLPTGNL